MIPPFPDLWSTFNFYWVTKVVLNVLSVARLPRQRWVTWWRTPSCSTQLYSTTYCNRVRSDYICVLSLRLCSFEKKLRIVPKKRPPPKNRTPYFFKKKDMTIFSLHDYLFSFFSSIFVKMIEGAMKSKVGLIDWLLHVYQFCFVWNS